MTRHYTFKVLYEQINSQKKDFWRTNIFGTLATLLLLPIPMLIPLLVDEVLLEHSGKMTEVISRVYGESEVWVYVLIILSSHP